MIELKANLCQICPSIFDMYFDKLKYVYNLLINDVITDFDGTNCETN